MRRHSHPLRSLQRVQRRRERRRAQNGPTDRLDSVAHRSAAHLALQRGLGLLPELGARAHPHHHHPRGRRPNLAARADVGIADRSRRRARRLARRRGDFRLGRRWRWKLRLRLTRRAHRRFRRYWTLSSERFVIHASIASRNGSPAFSGHAAISFSLTVGSCRRYWRRSALASSVHSGSRSPYRRCRHARPSGALGGGLHLRSQSLPFVRAEIERRWRH
jgi:hypothetical protein